MESKLFVSANADEAKEIEGVVAYKLFSILRHYSYGKPPSNSIKNQLS